MYIVFSILAIGFMILVHELGHFLTAKAVKMPVHELAIGFGPRLIKKEHKGVIYSLRAIPFGGFVSFGDEENEDALKDYYSVPVWKRALVTFAGSAVNILVAFLMCFALLWASGTSEIVNRIDTVSPSSPAEAAGLKPNDVILAVDGVDVTADPETISALIGSKQGAPFTLNIQRSDEIQTLELSPEFDETEQRFLIGITLGVVTVPVSPGVAFRNSFTVIGGTVASIFDFLRGLFTTGQGAGDVVGVVGVVSEMSTYGQTYGFATFLSIAVMIMVNLGVMNLLPIPGLDGSKLVFLLVEAIRRKPASPKVESIINLVGFGLLFILFILITSKDIVRLIFGG